MSIRAGIYTRISQNAGPGDVLGITRQREDCEALAKRKGWTVVEVFSDNDISAYSSKRRPGYEALLDAVREGRIQAVLTWDLDRLHRRPAELEDFIALADRHGLALANVSGEVDLASAAGRLHARIMGAVARHESEHKAERIRRKHQEMALAGRSIHGRRRPFGYHKGGVTIREDEAAEIRDAARRLLAGEGLRSVVVDWCERVPSVDGGTWSRQGVKRLLTSGRVAGYRTYKGEIVAKGEWEPILDEDTWQQLRALLWEPGRGASGAGYGPRRHVLRGLARCGRCRAKLRIAIRTRGRSALYGCPPTTEGIGSCGGVAVVAPAFEREVSEQVIATLTTGEGLAAALERASDDRPDMAAVVERLRADEEKLSRLELRYALEEIGKAAYFEARGVLAQRVEAARRTLARQQRAGILAQVPSTPEGLRDWYEAASVERKRELLDAVVAEVSLKPARRGANRFDPERVEILWRA